MNISISPNIAAYASLTDSGVANSNGIVFSSSNTVPQTILNLPVSQPNTQPILNVPNSVPSLVDSAPQLSGVNNALDFGSNYSPFNPPSTQTQQKPDRPQSAFSSSGLTFAPLNAASSPSISQHTNSTFDHMNHVNAVGINSKPSPPTVSHEAANFVPTSKPTSKCGISKYTSLRVVGGSITQIGTIRHFIYLEWMHAFVFHINGNSIEHLNWNVTRSISMDSRIRLWFSECIYLRTSVLLCWIFGNFTERKNVH